MAMCKVSSTLHFSKRSHSSSGKETEAHWIPNTDVYVMDGGLVIKVGDKVMDGSVSGKLEGLRQNFR